MEELQSFPVGLQSFPVGLYMCIYTYTPYMYTLVYIYEISEMAVNPTILVIYLTYGYTYTRTPHMYTHVHINTIVSEIANITTI